MEIRAVRRTVAMRIELTPEEVESVVWTGEHLGALVELLKGKPTMAQVRAIFENDQARKDVAAFFAFSTTLADMHARAQTQDLKMEGKA